MQKYIIVKADTNDADYITKKSKITDEQIKKIKHITKIISKNDNSWGKGEVGYNDKFEDRYKDLLSEEEMNLFENFTPFGEWGIHSIESVEILEVTNEEKLL